MEQKSAITIHHSQTANSGFTPVPESPKSDLGMEWKSFWGFWDTMWGDSGIHHVVYHIPLWRYGVSSLNLRKPRLSRGGFTMIEILIVISIIGILSSISLGLFTGIHQKRAYDAQRKSDIKEYQTSLEAYANQGSGLYPRRNQTVSADTTLCGDLGLSGCASDPKKGRDASFDYKYQSDGSASDGSVGATKYVLWAKLETISNYWVACSNGKVGTKSQDNFVVSGGNCPL